MRPLCRANGHEFFSPTYTGLGERAHLAHPAIDLSTHVQDVTAVLEVEDLQDVTLLGHSYGGMVATGAADRTGRARDGGRSRSRLSSRSSACSPSSPTGAATTGSIRSLRPRMACSEDDVVIAGSAPFHHLTLRRPRSGRLEG
jgi:pimeloyl-ACP methyl ester carboxylesterase